jgi:rRNA-processing protein FCF1
LPVRVLLDSNFLMIPLELHIDVFEEIQDLLGKRVEFILIKQVYDELRRLSARSSKVGRQAAHALNLAKRCRTMNVEAKARESTDDAIVRVAKDKGAIVATSDLELRKRLRNINVPVIYVRERFRLEVDGIEPEYV